MSKEQIVAAIKECAQQLERVPTFRDLQRFKPVKIHPIRKLFGNWQNAVKAAGLESEGIGTAIDREQILAAIRECAEKLGRVPTSAEFKLMKDISERRLLALFGTWTCALKACAMKPGKGIPVTIETMLDHWAALVRKMGRLPTVAEFELETRHSARTLRQRIGTWTGVPPAFVEYAEAMGLKDHWPDVLKIIERQPMSGTRASMRASAKAATWLRTTPSSKTEAVPSPKMLPDRKIYGSAFTNLPMVYAPVNEMGVVLLFGALARGLGLVITWIGTAFPDAEAMREVATGKHQPVKMEFELESRNFLKHLHNAAECDVIVCWVHNWPECPLEVIELSKVVSFQP